MAQVVFDLYARGEQRVAHAFRVVAGEADKAEKSTKSLNKAWGGLSTAGGIAGKAAVGLGVGIAGAAAGFVAMTDTVVGLNLQVGKAKVVFGSSFNAVDQALRRTSNQFGITRIEALGLAGTFADMAKQSGFSTSSAATMSTKFVELTGRVKFLSAGQFDAAQASEAVSAAFRGEYDSLQRVVPSISAARIETMAHAIQAKSSTKITLDQAKMLAVLKIVQDGVGTSNGLMATAEGRKAQALEESRTKMRDQWQEIQANLLPAFSTLWETVGKKLNPALQDLSEYLQSPEGKQAIEDWTNGIAGAVGAAAELASMIDDVILAGKRLAVESQIVWAEISLSAKESFVDIYDTLAGLPGPVGDSFEKSADNARAALKRVQDTVDGLKTERSQLEVQRLQNKINGLKGKTVSAKTSAADKEKAVREIGELQQRINILTGRTVTITARAVYSSDGSVRHIRPNGTLGPIMRARGGAVWGAGTETSDSIPAQLSHNEHVVSAAEVRGAGGHGAIERMRASWRGSPGFAEGGAVLGSARVAQALDVSVGRLALMLTEKLATKLGGGAAAGFIRSNVGKPYIWGSAGPGGYDCSGWMSAIIRTIRGEQYPYRRIGATGNFPWSGFARGPGSVMIGSVRGNPGHMAGTIFGLNTESTGSRGVIAGGNARGAGSGLFGGNIWHLRGYAAGGRVGDAPYDLLHPNGDEYLGDRVRPEMLLDGGGVATGRGILLKGTHAPERVLSAGQTRSFDRLVRVLDRGAGAAMVVNHFHFPNYVGDHSELKRALLTMDNRGDLDGIRRFQRR